MDSKKYIICILDVIKYTGRSVSTQVDLFKILQKEAYYFLFQEFHFDERVIAIPTGDGFILGIQEENDQSWLRALELILYLNEIGKENEFSLRYALNVGETTVLKDINKQYNLVGNLVNDTARIINCSEDGGVVVSDAFFRQYLMVEGWETGTLYSIPGSDLGYKISSEDAYYDKHNQEHKVYSVAISKDTVIESTNFMIARKYKANIYGPEYPKRQNLTNQFFGRVENAKELILFGIYHPNSLTILEHLEYNHDRIAKLHIYFAADDLESQILDYFESKDESLKKSNRKSTLKGLSKLRSKSDGKYLDLHIYEYNSLPTFGASIVDPYVSEKGFIHISNYYKGVLPKDSPYIETSWVTREMPPLYRFYLDQVKVAMDEATEIDI